MAQDSVDSAAAHYRHANLLKDRGEFETALASYDSALELAPDHAHAWCNRAVVLGQLGRSAEALTSYERAIELDPSDSLALCNRGYLLIALGRKDAALESLSRALAIAPNLYSAHFARGALLQEKQAWIPALAAYDRAVELNPGDPVAQYNRGTVLKFLERWESALDSFDTAISLRSNFAPAHSSRAEVLEALERWPEAVASYDRAIELNPQDAKTQYNRGVLLQNTKDWVAALTAYERAIALDPNYAQALFGRGTVQHELEDLCGALASYDRAIAAKPDFSDAYLNRGATLLTMGRSDEAAQSFEHAIALSPGLAEGHYNLALASLKAGDYVNGWKNYEWRWRAKSGPIFRELRYFPQPLWTGDDIADKTILLYGEQGLGDSLQFCRYAPLVAAKAARVILEVPQPLVNLCRTLQGVASVVPYGGPLPHFDVQCPLLSLPLAFGTTLETVPAPRSYLRSDAAKVAAWQERLGRAVKPRIGLTWSGHQTGGTHRKKRHFPLSMLAPYLSQRFQYVCLQTEITEFDRATLSTLPDIGRYDNELRDFADTAALADCMDLIVSVDTSVAHLGGALGKKTWVLLAFDADWRWLNDRDDSPWYPTLRLYRQRAPGDWIGVFERVAADLADVAARAGVSARV